MKLPVSYFQLSNFTIDITLTYGYTVICSSSHLGATGLGKLHVNLLFVNGAQEHNSPGPTRKLDDLASQAILIAKAVSDSCF